MTEGTGKDPKQTFLLRDPGKAVRRGWVSKRTAKARQTGTADTKTSSSRQEYRNIYFNSCKKRSLPSQMIWHRNQNHHTVFFQSLSTRSSKIYTTWKFAFKTKLQINSWQNTQSWLDPKLNPLKNSSLFKSPCTYFFPCSFIVFLLLLCGHEFLQKRFKTKSCWVAMEKNTAVNALFLMAKSKSLS